MYIKSITKNENNIYTISYKEIRFLPGLKKRKVFSMRNESTNWYWLDSGSHVGTKLSRVLTGVRSRNLDHLEN